MTNPFANYFQKLIQFNSTGKYRSELHHLERLIGDKHLHRVIDYGCGIGTAIEYLNERLSIMNYEGYDINKYSETIKYIDEPFSNADIVYFMHSFANIPLIENVLLKLQTDRVIIITPNKVWLHLNRNPNYIPDPTTIKHYTEMELIEILERCGYLIETIGTFGEKTHEVKERIFVKAKKIKI